MSIAKIYESDLETIKNSVNVSLAGISKIMGIDLVETESPYVWRDVFGNGDNWYLTDSEGVTRFANSMWELYETSDVFMDGNIVGYAVETPNQWHLVGDFDLVVDLNISSILNATTFSYFLFRVTEYTGGKGGANAICYIRGDGAGGLEYYEASDTNWGTLTTGSFRIRYVKSGTTLKLYVWHNDRWEWNGNTDGFTHGGTWDLVVGVQMVWHGVSSTSYLMGGVDTLTLVTGTRVEV